MVDLLIMGAGFTGLMAAFMAAKTNLKVRVIAKGWGALHWTPGTIDVLGYTLRDPNRPVRRPLVEIQAMREDRPGHPYALLGREHVADALNNFATISQEIGLPYSGAPTPGDNLLLPSTAGAARPTFMAPQAQVGGDLSRPEPMIIVGFQGLRDFYPQLIADNLCKAGHQARAAFLPFDLLSERRDANTVILASGLDNPERHKRLARELSRLAQPGERIGLPAILGMWNHKAVMAELEAETGATLFEIPTLPPGVPGIRLSQALHRHLQSIGVRVEVGMKVIDYQADSQTAVPGKGDRIRWVESQTSARPLKHRAHHFLLATGGILGGGFTSSSHGRIWECIFDLPLKAVEERSLWFDHHFLSPAGHPIFRGGIAVNDHFQPVNESGQTIYDNLRAAGNLLVHSDTIRERSREGVSITTAMAAVLAIGHGYLQSASLSEN